MEKVKVVKIKLSLPQLRFFRQEIEALQSQGDCTLKGFDLFTEDYEGAQAVARSFLSKKTKTTREYVTWNSTVDRWNAAIAKTYGKK